MALCSILFMLSVNPSEQGMTTEVTVPGDTVNEVDHPVDGFVALPVQALFPVTRSSSLGVLDAPLGRNETQKSRPSVLTSWADVGTEAKNKREIRVIKREYFFISRILLVYRTTQ